MKIQSTKDSTKLLVSHKLTPWPSLHTRAIRRWAAWPHTNPSLFKKLPPVRWSCRIDYCVRVSGRFFWSAFWLHSHTFGLVRRCCAGGSATKISPIDPQNSVTFIWVQYCPIQGIFTGLWGFDWRNRLEGKMYLKDCRKVVDWFNF